MVALVCAEILLQPDFGTFMVFVAILFGMLLVSGVQLRWLLVLALVGMSGRSGCSSSTCCASTRRSA